MHIIEIRLSIASFWNIAVVSDFIENAFGTSRKHLFHMLCD